MGVLGDGMGVLASKSVATLLERIEAALYLAAPPVSDNRQLESAYYQVLGKICALTEEEADLVEPAFTALEERISQIALPQSLM